MIEHIGWIEVDAAHKADVDTAKAGIAAAAPAITRHIVTIDHDNGWSYGLPCLRELVAFAADHGATIIPALHAGFFLRESVVLNLFNEAGWQRYAQALLEVRQISNSEWAVVDIEIALRRVFETTSNAVALGLVRDVWPRCVRWLAETTLVYPQIYPTHAWTYPLAHITGQRCRLINHAWMQADAGVSTGSQALIGAYEAAGATAMLVEYDDDAHDVRGRWYRPGHLPRIVEQAAAHDCSQVLHYAVRGTNWPWAIAGVAEAMRVTK